MEAEVIINNDDLTLDYNLVESEARAEVVLRRVLQGDSAYEVWVKDGNVGTPNDFFDWLRQGPRGDPGKDSYGLAIIPSNGAEVYRPTQQYSAVLTAKVFTYAGDVTDQFSPNCFVWERVSQNTAGDPAWNINHQGIGNVITLTQDDIIGDTLFSISVYSLNGQLIQQQILTF